MEAIEKPKVIAQTPAALLIELPDGSHCWMTRHVAARIADLFNVKQSVIERLERHIANLQADFRKADADLDEVHPDEESATDIGQSVVLEGQAMAIEALRIVVRDLRRGGSGKDVGL